MPLSKHMIDNRDDTVADHLRRNLSQADYLHMVSAYFSIYGYELLQPELEALDMCDSFTVNRLQPALWTQDKGIQSRSP